jgi:hypothetical protein
VLRLLSDAMKSDENSPTTFIIENLRLRELVTIVNANRPFFVEFEEFLSSEGYSDVRAFVFEPDDAKAIDIIERYQQHTTSAILYDGLARPYERGKAKFYFLAWLFRDAPAQRLGPLIERGSGRSLARRRAKLLNEVRRFVAPLFPEPASWTWHTVSEVMLARLEGSRRALKGNFLEAIVREILTSMFVELGISLNMPNREVRLHDETYDIQVIGRSGSILIPVKTRETMGGGHAMLFTRDIHKSISIAHENGFECIPIVIAESWGGDLSSLNCENLLYLKANPNQIPQIRSQLETELRNLSKVFVDLAQGAAD